MIKLLLVFQSDRCIKNFQEAFDKNVKSFNDLQREKFGPNGDQTERT